MTSSGGNPRRRLLIIDDNSAIHEDFQKILGDASAAQANLREAESALFGTRKQDPVITAFEVDCAAQGQEGLALVRQALAEGRPYTVAFVDGRMPPGWDGIETISHLWRVQSDLQVVLCTAYSDYTWEDIRRVLGETDNLLILKKPFDNVEVLQLAHTLTKKWTLSRQLKERLEDLDRLVSERTRQMHRALTLLEASIAQSPAGILIAEAPDAIICLANAAAVSIGGEAGQVLSGSEAGEHINRWQIFHPDGAPYPAEELPLARAVRHGETTRDEEVIIRTTQGGDRWVSVNAAPIRNAAGSVIAGIAVINDTTERRRAEMEKESLQAQFEQAQKMESVGRLAGGVAHDFNNMLTAILGNVEMALEGIPVESEVGGELIEIRKAAQRSADLTRQLLAFARKQTINPTVLDLNDTVAGMLKLLCRLIGENIELDWIPGSDLWLIKIDSGQIDQILANLCVNARDAITGVGTLLMETANVTLDDSAVRLHPDCPAGDYVALTVTDTGCGMDAETRSHLFEPFFTTKAVGKGTGLGLATVFGIVKQNGGLIEVQSAPGRGTTFKICLPRAAAEVEAPSGVVPRAQEEGDETVLLVEDEPQVLHLGRCILEKSGYTVLSASTPTAAMELIDGCATPIHLVLTDVVMPEMNGRELCDRLRAIRPELKCLFMSGYTADVLAPHGVLDGTMHFIQKPFRVHDLLRKVRATLDGPEISVPRSISQASDPGQRCSPAQASATA